MAAVFTLSAYETNAREFFTALLEHRTDLVLDVRLKNKNQLCGFTKEKDLQYLVPMITGAAYIYDVRFAPSPELLDAYQHHFADWNTYRSRYLSEMKANNAEKYFHEKYGKYQSICLLGTATRKRRSHSEILLELVGGH